MACILDGATLTLTGFVGDNYWNDGFTHGEVLLALAQVEPDSDLTVHINSGGGYATEGAAVHALLARRPGRTDVVVDGIAASAASLIAEAGDTVTMSPGSVMMIHDPAGLTWGNSADHAKTIEGLEALATSYARVYAEKSGRTAEDCRAVMKAETWFTPEQAVEAGFADATGAGESKPVAAFDYRAYAHAPDSLTALAAENRWTFKAQKSRPKASAAAPTGQQKEKPTMTDQPKAENKPADTTAAAATATAAADAVRADRDRRAAIMALPEAQGREALADHLHMTTEMSVDQVKAALASAPGTDTPQAHDQRRANAAAGLAIPAGAGGQQKQTATLNPRAIYAKRNAAG